MLIPPGKLVDGTFGNAGRFGNIRTIAVVMWPMFACCSWRFF